MLDVGFYLYATALQFACAIVTLTGLVLFDVLCTWMPELTMILLN